MEEERGHSASSEIVAWGEVGINEGGRVASGIRHACRVTVRICRGLHLTRWQRDDEVAV